MTKAPEDILRNFVDLLTALKIIEFWSIGIQNDEAKLISVVIKGEIYGEMDRHTYEWIRKG